jgi:hypothetical protein
MLISMPTGTSTILGVFQAILALLVKSGELALPNKLLRKEKFASEIFVILPPVLCCSARGIHGFVRFAAKPKRHQWVQNSLVASGRRLRPSCRGERRGEELAR